MLFENEVRNDGGLQKEAEANVNLDCFLLVVQSQWKL